MIAALTGEIRHVDEHSIHLQSGPILYELLVPAAAVPELQANLGQTVTFHTIFYLAGDPTRGGQEPTLIGFLHAEDKKFFNLFTTVKGIGPRRALRALTVPVGELAAAIESKDAKFLVGLPEIGKRTAEQIVAELAGKLKDFVTTARAAGLPAAGPASRRSAMEEDAIAAMTHLGERRADAENLLHRALAANPDLASTDQLLREMLRLRAG
jgi:Holliday junction DNA helicase RuvA